MTHKINQRGLDLIKSFEGFRATPYYCPAGVLTVGYGHAIRKGETFDKPLSQEEAEELLAKDVLWAELAVNRNIKVPLTDNQFAALVSFTFNVGSGALQRSTLRMKINRGEHGEVRNELMKWVIAGGRVNAGLKRRREMEADLYEEES